MNTPSLQRRWRWLVFAAVLLVFPSLALAVVKDGDKSKIHPQPFSDSRHIPGRLIVKYKDTLTQCAHCLLRQGRSFQSALSDGSPSLDTLHRRFGVQSATPLFRRESSIQASSMVTLSQLRMTEQQELAAIKVKFPARTKRIPTGATSPNVYHVYLLQLPRSANIEQAAAEFSKDPHVAYAHPDYQVKTFWTPNDPYYASSNSWGQGYQDLWGLHRINASRAWDYSMGTGIKVAVIDTGVDYNHADLAANIWVNPCEDLNRNNRVDASDFNGRDDACTGESPNGYIDDVRGWDFATDPDDNNPMDVNGHGTHLSGTIAALGNNARGIVGVAPQAKIMAVKGDR
ncbi:MAG: S8 family serine peptidase [Candidatus Omnitrophica bacterium]|nr:S8 family serine peptidase [Candidatus Omnitrophota bacterium]